MTFKARFKVVPLAAALLIVGLSGCALETSIDTGQPINPTQVQQDLQTTKEVVETVGCVAEGAAAVAAPIVDANGDQAAQADLATADKVSTVLCGGSPAPSPAPSTAPQQ